MYAKIAFMLAFLGAIGAALAQSKTPEPQTVPSIGQVGSPADDAYMDAMQKMQQAILAMDMSGDASGDYARIMIVHQQGALEMAEVLLKQKRVDPTLKKLVERIKAEEKRGMADLQRWLNNHQQ
jgi:uncharacterized protein (DUF305 family)